MADLTAIILTYNEEKNIVDCIHSIKNIVKRIVVIDSFSTDKTVTLAQKYGAEVIQHEFINHSKQYIWGEQAANIQTKWVFRIDADERLTPESAAEIEQICDDNMTTNINGIIVRFKVTFLGKDLRHGGIYPFRKLLVYKYGYGYMENRNMDEHIILSSGKCVELKHDSLHYDYKGLTEWIDKHNKYSTRETIDYCNMEKVNDSSSNLDIYAKFKRFVKFKIYYKLPIGTRAHLYYWYRYYFKFGFLDGREGKIFAFMQAYWYRFLVDAKIYEFEHVGDKKCEKF